MKIINKKTIYLSVIILLLILTFIFPYTHDDWDWGSAFGLERLNNFFKDYNGRYISNTLAIILTRSNILKTIFMSAILFGTLYLSYKLINDKKIAIFYLSILLLLFIPRDVFRQGIVWTSGFVNYSCSIFLILLYFYLNVDIFSKFNERKSFPNILLLFLLGIFSSLFLENTTIFNIVISLGLIIFIFIKYRKWSFKNIAYFVGSVVGAIIMFTNSAYSLIASSDDFYRTIPKDFYSLIQTAVNNTKIITKYLFFENIILVLTITTLLILIYLKNNKKNIFLNITALTNVGFSIYILMKLINPYWQILLKYTSIFEHIFLGIYLISCILIIWFTISDKKKVSRIIFYIISSLVLGGSLLIVTPIGARNCLGNHVLLILIILELFDYLYQKENSFIKQVLILSCIILYVNYLSIYAYIYRLNNEVVNFINKESQTKNVIEIPEIPNGNRYTQAINFSSFTDKYKAFYGINEEVEFIVLPYNEWHKKYK